MSRRRPAQTTTHHDHEGDTQPCTRGCTRWGQHQPHCPDRDADLPDDHPDRCDGCLPWEADTGLLCRRCFRLLDELLGTTPEGVETVCAWLATNLGQHIRSKAPGNTSRSANPGEGFVTVMAALSDLQIAWAEMAADFLASRAMRPLGGTDPAHVGRRIRPWATTLASWEPIADNIDHLIALRGQAHGVCPWRGKEPAEAISAAILLRHAPAQTTAEICDTLGVTEAWMWQSKRRGKITPLNDGERPLRWLPWDIYRHLYPDAAKRYEAEIEQSQDREVVYRAG